MSKYTTIYGSLCLLFYPCTYL